MTAFRLRLACAGAFAFLLAVPALAQTPPALVTNGCGAGRFAFLVPNGTLLSSCQFKSACDSHDRCYSRCLAGGELAGNSSCGVAQAKALRRQVCDVALQDDIIADNASKPVCSMYAAIYRFAVQLMGERFFNGIGGSPAALGQLNEFLTYLAANPDAFDLAEVERAFREVDDRGLAGMDYEFWLFQGPPPLLVARRAGQELFKVAGRPKSP